jgi:2,3-bisphosphoglycerate-dependent phosphoglycerate mutase
MPDVGVHALLIRHCESTGQAPDAPLTARGRVQADVLADALDVDAIARVVTSPWQRARETAAPLAGQGTPAVDDRLREWQLPHIPDADWPHAMRAIFAGATALPADVEPMDAARARGLAALHDALDGAGPVALVTHGKLLALIVSTIGAGDPYDVFVALRNPHVFDVWRTGTALTTRSR